MPNLSHTIKRKMHVLLYYNSRTLGEEKGVAYALCLDSEFDRYIYVFKDSVFYTTAPGKGSRCARVV